MSFELPDPQRDEDVLYLDEDLAGWDGWVARGLERLEQHLAKWAEFVRRHGP